MKQVYIPPTVDTIHKSAFNNRRTDLTIYGVAGSRAEEFARENNITFSTKTMPGLKPSELHSIAKMPAQAPTYKARGNKEYYVCLNCGRMYTDATAEHELTEKEVFIPKLSGHSGGSGSSSGSHNATSQNGELGFYSAEDKTVVNVSGIHNLPAGARLSVNNKKSGQEYNRIKDTLKKMNKPSFEVLDISILLADGSKFEPDGPVTLTITYPATWSHSVSMYYMDDKGKVVENIPVKVQEVNGVKQIIATVTHFSNYVIAENTNEASAGGSSPRTGEESRALYVMILVIIMTACAASLKRIKNN